MGPKNTICLWFDQGAHEAASFYAATFPNSRVDRTNAAAGDYPGGQEGNELTVEFTLLGRRFLGGRLHGGRFLGSRFLGGRFLGDRLPRRARGDRLLDRRGLRAARSDGLLDGRDLRFGLRLRPFGLGGRGDPRWRFARPGLDPPRVGLQAARAGPPGPGGGPPRGGAPPSRYIVERTRGCANSMRPPT